MRKHKPRSGKVKRVGKRDSRKRGSTISSAVFRVILATLLVTIGVSTVGASEYKLGPGDVISIRVFGQPDLTYEQLRLTDSGSFSYPFLGEVDAMGLTTGQLESHLSDGLRGDYLVDPKVSISILEYREFFVNGYVKSPGGYPFKPGLTVEKAIALAGGLTERASDDRFEITREEKINPEAGEKHIQAEMDTPVMPGDIITVKQRFF